MQSSQVPSKFNIPFANSAGPGYVRPIPQASQIGVNTGWASLTDGFPPLTMTPEASGGVPPFGQDMNGVLLQITQWSRWQSAGGPVLWDAAFSAAVGGYPKGAVVRSVTTFGYAYECLVENNTTNPDAGGAGWRGFYVSGSPALFSGTIYGLTITPTPAAPLVGITVSVGSCQDRTNTYTMNSAVPLDKRLNATWAVGNAQGGRMSGTLANGGTWHMFALMNPTSGAVEFGFDQSPSNPTMTLPAAAGYTVWRRIGAVVLEAASTNIRPFWQVGDWFMLQTRSVDYAATSNGGLVAYLRAITVPVGIVVNAMMYFQSTGSTGPVAYLSGIYNPAFGAPPAFGGSTQWAQVRRLSVYTDAPGVGVSWNSYGTVVCTQFTDANARVYTRSSDNLDSIALGVLGWEDQRGQFYPDP